MIIGNMWMLLTKSDKDECANPCFKLKAKRSLVV